METLEQEIKQLVTPTGIEVDEQNTENKIAEAVQNLVTAIRDTVKPEEPAKQQETNEEQKRNSYYVEGVPFLVELKFTHWSQEIEDTLMKCFMKDEALLPGLKINKLYKATLHSDSLYLDSISEKLDNIKLLVDNYRSEIDVVMKQIVRQAR